MLFLRSYLLSLKKILLTFSRKIYLRNCFRNTQMFIWTINYTKYKTRWGVRILWVKLSSIIMCHLLCICRVFEEDKLAWNTGLWWPGKIYVLTIVFVYVLIWILESEVRGKSVLLYGVKGNWKALERVDNNIQIYSMNVSICY